MPSWRRVIVSGSDASLNSLFVANAVTASIFSGSSHIGSHTGSLFGTASYVTGSIFFGVNPALSASYALTASYALNGGTGGSGLKTKAGQITALSFQGNPRTASVSFTTAFSDTNYGVVITGEDSRTWTIQGKLAAGFTASSNSNVALSGLTYWIATAYGETA